MAVGSAGNSYSSSFVYPAAFKNVISVSVIGHENKTWISAWGSNCEIFLDRHEWEVNGEVRSAQHNDSIDIVAPGYAINNIRSSVSETSYFDRTFGTSYASPMVCGTIALMLDVNYYISPKEIESILKLTAVKIDHLPQNIQYYGKLGVGKLDAYKAVKMARDMADALGTVEVKDRILYRWFYKLETAPNKIKMTNNDVTGNARLKLKARNNIEIISGDYYPETGGYIDLSIDESLALDCPPAPSNSSKQSNSYQKDNKDKSNSNFEIMPTLVSNNTLIKQLEESKSNMNTFRVYDFFGVEVYYKKVILENEVNIDLEKLVSGIYIVKVFDSQGVNILTQKIIKK